LPQLSHGTGDHSRNPAPEYLPADFDRLVELKRRYDLKNVFRINHDIDPTINETRRTA
jgi:hypothetical protein